MFVKQIDMKTALELAARGREQYTEYVFVQTAEQNLIRNKDQKI